jgi:major vault protein
LLPFVVAANNLHITQVDIQSIDPVEEETRLSLQKSVNMAFEIQTRSQEAAAQH